MQFTPILTSRLLIRPTGDEEVYRLAMIRSHRELEPSIYPPELDFRFHPGKRLFDICLNENKTFIGGFSLHSFADDNKACELGYWVLPEYQGQGLIREAALALLKNFDEQRQFERISLTVDPRNQRSIKLASALGFAHEAYLKGVDRVSGEVVVKYLFARYRGGAR